MDFLKLIVTLSFTVCIIFTITILIFSIIGIEVSDTLIECFFKVFGTELGATAAIKISDKILKRWQIVEKIKMLKKEGLPIEKKDLELDDSEDAYEGDGTYYG